MNIKKESGTGETTRLVIVDREIELPVIVGSEGEVDFYSGIVLRALGIPTNMFTVIFALGRLPGWISQWREDAANPNWRLYRPRQIYTGPNISRERGRAAGILLRSRGQPADGQPAVWCRHGCNHFTTANRT
mgnify:CR=1 FL=1